MKRKPDPAATARQLIASAIVIGFAELSCQLLLKRSLFIGPVVHLIRQVLPQ